MLLAIIQHPDIVTPPNHAGEAKAWCPWHPDRAGGKPSLGINVQKKVVKCWVCGEGGVRKLAQAWGIAKPPATVKANRPPWEREIDRTFDYNNPDGSVLFQVVRFKVPTGADKDIMQRRRDPSDTSKWVWNLKGVRPILYELPRLRAADPEARVLIPEGETDVDRLRVAGFVATTNPMGAGKWRGYYDQELKGRHVVILPDNDSPGRAHATTIAGHLHGVAASVRVVELPDLPPKGDVSDWLDQGYFDHELAEVIEATPLYEPDQEPDSSDGNGVTIQGAFWEPSRWRPVATELIRRLRDHGFFVKAEGRYYFFDYANRMLCEIDGFDMAVLLNERYQVNETEPLYKYLVKQLRVETAIRGNQNVVRQFGHYDAKANELFLDMNNGSVLRLDGITIKVRDNGADGVLFSPTRYAEPWDYIPGPPEATVKETIIKTMNFVSEESSHTPDEQETLMLLWMLSIPFESVQPTKPLALAIGPSGSGKSSLFRRIGQLLFGPEYQVDALRRDKEDDYWVAVTGRPFVTFDNVDGYFPWLQDALAQSSTGVQVSKRELYTTHNSVTFTPRCMISLTARTPAFRREDVASRLLIFHLDRLQVRRPEYDLLAEITDKRNSLMSDYAQMLNSALAATPSGTIAANIRLADFAGVADRIGHGLGINSFTNEVLDKLPASQWTFATEENPVYLALDAWLSEPPRVVAGQMDIPTSNVSRRITTHDLFGELRVVTEKTGMPFRVKNATSLGLAIKNMEEELGLHFQIETGRTNKGRWYSFAPRIGNEN